MYKCEGCKYKTDIKCNIEKHKRTTRHKEREEEEKEKRIRKLEEEIKKMSNVEERIIKIELMIEKNIGIYRYINIKYDKVKEIEDVNKEKIKKMIGEVNLVEILIKKYNDKKLKEYMGELIIKEYKKEDDNMTIWCTDIARKNFIIKGEKEWKRDKKGTKIKELIIRPLKEYMMKQMDEYGKYRWNNVNKIFRNDMTIKEIEKEKKRSMDVVEIKTIFLNKEFEDEIIRYVTKYFVMNKK
jgi:hypothetical protein